MDLLGMLADAGMSSGDDFNDGIEGYFGWSVGYESGFLTITLDFTDYGDCDWEMSGRDNEMPRYQKKYRLTPVEG